MRSFIGGADLKSLDTSGYAYPQWVYFLNSLPDTLTLEQMSALDLTYGFTKTHNDEVLFAWLMQVVKHHYTPAMPALRDFLTSQGRGKYCTPLYKALMGQPGWGPEAARRIYAEARPGYHEVTRARVDALVK